MNVETLEMLSTAAFIVSAVFLLVAVILFFTLKIKTVIDELTGNARRKAIKNIRDKNNEEKSAKGKTGKIDTSNAAQQSMATAVLDDSGTEVLYTNETAVLASEGNKTAVLDCKDTVYSYSTPEPVFYTENAAECGFEVEEDIELCESRGIE